MDRISTAASAIRTTQKELTKLLSDARFDSQFEVKEEEEELFATNSIQRTEDAKFVEDTNKFIQVNRKLFLSESRVKELEKEIENTVAQRNEALMQARRSSNEAERLRRILTESMRETEKNKLKMMQAQSFFDSLGGVSNDPENLIKFSEPPQSFKAYKVESTHGTELETTKARLKQAEADLNKLRNKFDYFTEQNAKIKKEQGERVKEAEKLLAGKHTQVLGAVRRVHYLLEQNEKYQKDLKKKDTYINKLELKLLDLNRQVNSAPTITRKQETESPYSSRSPEPVAPPEVPSVNWDSVFKQCKLGRSVSNSPLTHTQGSTPKTVHTANEKYRDWVQKSKSPVCVGSKEEGRKVKKLTPFEELIEQEAVAVCGEETAHEEWLSKVGVTS
uniref:Uncharacterized protein n=1 Tax=Mucochytrium quahogii TaxID=96639 RepID=A0A7S2R694_9STRA|mmetsp:Transcript_23046/g.36696  ORF Transcript_23046/g.36696 Transcript_23046/m.36696 type:complete len:390 (+) Transcript_23046:903-2072(+)